MATITLTIPDAQLLRIQNALCALYGYQTKLPDGSANPVSQAAFSKQQIVNYIQQSVLAYEVPTTMQATQTAASQAVLIQIPIS